jgi:hypothetical protein
MCRKVLHCFIKISMNSFSIDSDEAMQRGDEALNASSIQFYKAVFTVRWR